MDSIYGSKFYDDVSTGQNDGTVSVEECEAYANTISGSNWETTSYTNRPNGCYHSGSSYRFAANGNLNCGTSTDICIQKRPAKPVRTISDATLPHGALYRPLYYEQTSGSPDASVSQAECDAYVTSIGETIANKNLDASTRPSGCFRTSAGYFFNVASTNHECDDGGGTNSGTCIQKNPVTYYEKSSGSPDLSMSESECQVYAGSASFSSGSW